MSCNSKLKKWQDFSSDSGELEYLLDCRASQIKKRRSLSGFKRVTLDITLEKVASWSEENEAMYIFDSQENIYFDGEVSIQSGAKGNYVVLLSMDEWSHKQIEKEFANDYD